MRWCIESDNQRWEPPWSDPLLIPGSILGIVAIIHYYSTGPVENIGTVGICPNQILQKIGFTSYYFLLKNVCIEIVLPFFMTFDCFVGIYWSQPILRLFHRACSTAVKSGSVTWLLSKDCDKLHFQVIHHTTHNQPVQRRWHGRVLGHGRGRDPDGLLV